MGTNDPFRQQSQPIGVRIDVTNVAEALERLDGAVASRSGIDTNSVEHENLAMRNVTITLDEETAHWARVEAAHRDMSVSRFISELLNEHMRTQATYEDAMRRYLARAPVTLKGAGGYPSREELHDRDGLR